MRRLMLLRHAEAGWSASSDHERPLTADGRRAASRVGERLAATDAMPDRALVSSALRTRQTWEHLSSGWPDVPLDIEDDVYEASSRRLLQVVRERGADATTLLLVGHNPGVHDLLTTLARRDQHARTPVGFPPATLAVIELPVIDWREAEPGTGAVVRVFQTR